LLVGVRAPSKSRRRASDRLSAISRRRNRLGKNAKAVVSGWTRINRRDVLARTRPLLAADPVPAHDLQQAPVIGEAALSGRVLDVPVVALQSGHDGAELGRRFAGV